MVGFYDRREMVLMKRFGPIKKELHSDQRNDVEPVTSPSISVV